MNRKQLLAVMAMLVMSCLIFAQGPARDPKTGKFIKKSAMKGHSMMSHSKMAPKGHPKMSKSAFNAAHPRDAKGRFIKKHPMGMHSMPARDPMTGQFISKKPKMHSHMMKSNMMKSHAKVKKPGIIAKVKSLLHKKKH